MTSNIFKNRSVKVSGILIGSFLSLTVLFQNCSNKEFSQFENASATLASQSAVVSGSTNNQNSSTGNAATAGQIVVTLATTRGGAATNMFTVGQVMYGTVTGMSAQGAYGCIEFTSETKCNSLANFTALPNADWSYSNGAWRAAITLQAAYGGKQFRSYSYDSMTQKMSAPYVFQIRNAETSSGGAVFGPAPVAATNSCAFVAYDFVIGPTAPPSFECNLQNKDRIIETSKLICKCK